MILKNPHLEIPKEKPFKEDRLGREDNIAALTELIKNYDSPFVLAIDSSWGNGKTTFIEMWKQYLENDGYPVIKFNAWENDFSDNALVSLMGEINEWLKTYSTKGKNRTEVEDALKKAKKFGVKVLKSSLPGVIKALTLGIIDKEVLKDVLSNINEKIAEESFKAYEEARETISDLKKELIKFTEDIIGNCNGDEKKVLVIFIDELDRCRPTYAIDVLEKVKHIFDIPNIVFILGIDKEQLGHSIQSIYGCNFGIEGYLKRFIDITFNLPEGTKNKFLEYLFYRFEIVEFLLGKQGNKDITANALYNFFLKLFSLFNFSLRDQEQCVSHLNIILRTHKSSEYRNYHLIAFFLIMKHVKKDLFNQFANHELTIHEMKTQIKQFMKGEKKSAVDIEKNEYDYILIPVEVDLYIALEEEPKYADDIKKIIDHYEGLAKSEGSAERNIRARKIMESYKSRRFHINFDIDQLFKKIELLERIKIS